MPWGAVGSLAEISTRLRRRAYKAKGSFVVTNKDSPRLISDMRGVRYGEVLAVYAKDNGLEAEVLGTQMLNDCPEELWRTLDANVIAKEMGALLVKLNGPRYWVIDGIGQKVAVIEPIFRDFNGLTMRRIAAVDLGKNAATQPYTERHVNRGAVFFFELPKVRPAA